MIINKNQFPIVSSERGKPIRMMHTGRSSLYSIQHMMASKFKDTDYFYMNIHYNVYLGELDIKTLMPEKYFTAVLNGSLGLCIDFCHEALPMIVEVIYKNIVVKYNIDPKNILLIFGSPDIKQCIRETAVIFGCDEIQVEWFNYFEMTMQNQNFPFINPLKLKNHTKSYINLNRIWKPHRVATLFSLESRNLLDKGFNSFSYNPEMLCTVETAFHDFKESDIIDELKNGVSAIDKLPLVLDITDFTYNPNRLDYKIASYFVKSFLSLVSETFFKNDMPRFLSEKSFKPIFAKHPFILLSTPGSLDLMKSIGYKTFEGIIDESYDKEINEGNRLKLAIDQLERIVNYSNSDIENFKENCIPIVEENFELLRNKEIFLYDIDSLSFK